MIQVIKYSRNVHAIEVKGEEFKIAMLQTNGVRELVKFIDSTKFNL